MFKVSQQIVFINLHLLTYTSSNGKYIYIFHITSQYKDVQINDSISKASFIHQFL